jgi:hypothetical protein
MNALAATPNAVLADRASRLGRLHPPRAPGRRAAAMAYAALATSRTPEAARRALETFGDPAVRHAARPGVPGEHMAATASLSRADRARLEREQELAELARLMRQPGGPRAC